MKLLLIFACVKLGNIASQTKIFAIEPVKMLKFDFSADCSAVAHKAGNFDMFGSRRLVKLAGHNIANFLIHFKVKCHASYKEMA